MSRASHRPSLARPGASRWLAVSLLLALPGAAFAAGPADDEPIPYDAAGARTSETQERKRTSEFKSGRRDGFQRHTVDDAAADEEDRVKEPSGEAVGLGLDAIAGALLLESSRGAGVDTRFAGGARLTWEAGRHLGEDFLKERLFVDVSWLLSGALLPDGTAQVNATSVQHYFAVAPAFAIPFGERSPVAFFLQLGGGINYNASQLSVGGTLTQVWGLRGLLQYGGGVRARIPLSEEGALRLSLRVEVTRFLRGYMHDTLLGLSVGLVF